MTHYHFNGALATAGVTITGAARWVAENTEGLMHYAANAGIIMGLFVSGVSAFNIVRRWVINCKHKHK